MPVSQKTVWIGSCQTCKSFLSDGEYDYTYFNDLAELAEFARDQENMGSTWLLLVEKEGDAPILICSEWECQIPYLSDPKWKGFDGAHQHELDDARELWEDSKEGSNDTERAEGGTEGADKGKDGDTSEARG